MNTEKDRLENLTITKYGSVYTTSVILADVFGVPHEVIVDGIKGLLKSEDTPATQFAPAAHRNADGEEFRYFHFGLLGVLDIIGSLQGAIVDEIRDDYRSAFKREEQRLQQHKEDRKFVDDIVIGGVQEHEQPAVGKLIEFISWIEEGDRRVERLKEDWHAKLIDAMLVDELQ